MIEISNLFKQHGQQLLFNGLNLEVEKGSVVAVIGPSGSGKSTLLRCINGLEYFQKGRISVDGQKLYGVNEQSYNKAMKSLVMGGIAIRNACGKIIRLRIKRPDIHRDSAASVCPFGIACMPAR